MPERLPPAAWTVAVQGVDMAAQLAAGIAVARLLGPEAMGAFTFAFAVAAILAIFVLFGTGEVAIQLYGKPAEHRPQAVLGATLLVVGGGAVVCILGGGAVIAAMDLAPLTRLAVALALATLLLNGLAVALNLAVLAFDASRRDLVDVAWTRALLLVGVAAGAWTGSLVVVLVAYIGGAALLTAARWWHVHTRLFPARPELDRPTTDELWRRGRHVGVGSIFGVISSRSDMLLLEHLTSTAEVGLYGAAYRLINGVQAGSTAVATALYPGYARAVEAGAVNRTRRLFVAFPVACAAGLVVVALTLAEPIVVFVFGEAYRAAGPLFEVLLAAAAVQTLITFAAKALIARHQERHLPPAQALSAATNLGLNLVFIASLGGLGAAWATLAAEVVLVGWYGWALRRPGALT